MYAYGCSRSVTRQKNEIVENLAAQSSREAAPSLPFTVDDLQGFETVG